MNDQTDRRDYGPVDKVPFTVDHLLAHLQIEAVLRGLLQRAHDEIERLNDENEALRIRPRCGLLPHGRHGGIER